MGDFVKDAEALFLGLILASAGENMYIDENSGQLYVNSPEEKENKEEV